MDGTSYELVHVITLTAVDKVIRCLVCGWVVGGKDRDKEDKILSLGFPCFSLTGWDSVLTSLQNVPMSNNGAAGSDIEEKLSNLSVEKASYPSEMFRKERASFKLNKSSKGKII